MVRTSALLLAVVAIGVPAAVLAHSNGCCLPNAWALGENIATGGTIHQMNVAYEKSASSGDFQFGAFMQNSSFIVTGGKAWSILYRPTQACTSGPIPPSFLDNMDNCVGASARHNTFTTTVTIAGQEAEVWADVNDSQETLTYLAVVPGKCIPVGGGGQNSLAIIYNVTDQIPSGAFNLPSFCGRAASFVEVDMEEAAANVTRAMPFLFKQ